MNRVMIRRLVAMVAVLITCAFDAHAKVASITIESIQAGLPRHYASRAFNGVILGTKPLVMASVDGNPTVTFRIYMATPDAPDDFVVVRSRSQLFDLRFTHEGREFHTKLDSNHESFHLDSLFRELPAGRYKLRMTADDGEGESPMSNAVELELAPDPRDVLSSPVIESAISPATGLVVLRVAPIAFEGKGYPPLWFRVYRADGVVDDPEALEVITWGVTGDEEPRIERDDVEDASSHRREIAIRGSRSGMRSFRIEVQLEPGPEHPAISSNIVSVDVAGNHAVDDPSFRITHVTPPASVADDVTGIGDGAVLPNPATNVISLDAGSDASLRVRVLDARGRVRIDREVATRGGRATIDVSALESGVYWSVVGSDGRMRTHQFSVVR